MLIHSTDECKNKQEVVIRFIQKLIPSHDILNERVCSKFKHLRWVVAEDMAMKICKTLYRQTHRKTGSWHWSHTKRNPIIWHATRKSTRAKTSSICNECCWEDYNKRLLQTDTGRQTHMSNTLYNIFVLFFSICHKYDIFNDMPRKLLHHTGSSYVSRRKRLYHLPETVLSPMTSNPSRALIVRFHII
jgi:hypothetical protein